MLSLRRLLAVVALLVATRGALPAAEWRLPPVDGELSGDFALLKMPGAPKLHWQIGAQRVEEGLRAFTLALDGPGARVRASAQLDAAGNGTWRITEAQVDLGPWLPALAPYLPAPLADLSLAGTLSVTGEATWRAGQLGGACRLTLRDARVDDPALKLLLEGVSLDLAIDDLATGRTPASQKLAWRAGRYEPFALGAGEVEFSLANGQVQVAGGRVGVFAGEMTVGPFACSFANPVFAITANLRRVELATLVPFFPAAVAEAHGKLDGTIALARDAAGIHLGTGGLKLSSGEAANLKFTPSPGMISASLPAAVQKFYPGIKGVEEGRIAFDASELEVTFTPSGDEAGRTALVHLAGGREARAPLDVVVNVRGPLEWLVDMGTDSRFHFR